MGGTDKMDQNIANCRVNIRTKKWWWPLFVFCLNTSTHNAWCLYRKSAAAKQRSFDFLGFLRHIALSYVYKYRRRVITNRPGAMEVSVSREVDQLSHTEEMQTMEREHQESMLQVPLNTSA
ncbi:PiggyBac transposable element-derived protein 3 [Elysia marginata]|uniref:PiggyBac transposable element-derived protein 3 n=1 Tax=Elysia marginata TaxID=1093978 RepID=A0AAV4JAS3_9GAST|nr:PiggyBac transposable element-derived protein 3 [Elysia marginata]